MQIAYIHQFEAYMCFFKISRMIVNDSGKRSKLVAPDLENGKQIFSRINSASRQFLLSSAGLYHGEVFSHNGNTVELKKVSIPKVERFRAGSRQVGRPLSISYDVSLDLLPFFLPLSDKPLFKPIHNLALSSEIINALCPGLQDSALSSLHDTHRLVLCDTLAEKTLHIARRVGALIDGACPLGHGCHASISWHYDKGSAMGIIRILNRYAFFSSLGNANDSFDNLDDLTLPVLPDDQEGGIPPEFLEGLSEVLPLVSISHYEHDDVSRVLALVPIEDLADKVIRSCFAFNVFVPIHTDNSHSRVKMLEQVRDIFGEFPQALVQCVPDGRD